MRAWALALVSAACLCGQTEHKDKATDYPVHAVAGKVAIGADYLVHSIPAGDQTFVASDYLVVEVAVFPAFAQPVTIDDRNFTLRLNGKSTLTSQAPGFVAASLKYPDWEQHPTAVASGGVGNAGVSVGLPPPVARFPDDPNARRPTPPQAPSPEEQNGVERTEPETAEQVIARTALLEGRTDHPVSGFLYFRYKGKIKSLKSVELLYQDKDGSAILKLL